MMKIGNGIVFQFNVVHMVRQPMSKSFNSKTFDDENGNGIVFQFNVVHMVSQPMSSCIQFENLR